MSHIANLYAKEVKKHFKVLHANWEPGGPIELGDYGIMDGKIFIPMGKLKNDFPEFSGNIILIAPDSSRDQKEFKSESGVEMKLGVKGSVNSAGTTLVKATLEIKFANKDSIFFNAAECTTTRISNKAKIGEILKHLLKNKRWKKEYCVVTDIVKAGKTVVAISQSNNSSILFEADSPAIEQINLADASVKFNLTSEKNIGYKVDALEGLDILIGLCKIKNSLPWQIGNFEPEKGMLKESMKYGSDIFTEIKTESSVDELIFEEVGED
jgi:hypothetical protein